MATETRDDGRVERLVGGFRGDVIGPGDDGYDEARAVWNGAIDRRPALVARCADVADVRAAVAYGRAVDGRVTVRGGGHNVAGTAVRDDALVVDLSAMTAVRVDPDGRTAWVQGGATWADVDHATQAFGLAAPGGVVSDTGVGGLTLGGGVGHLRRAHGLSCDNLRAVELVTADGERVTASEDAHPDLFWALRGGGRAPGVVTGFTYDLHPVGPAVATCLVFYPGDRLVEVLEGYRAFAADAPREVSTLVFAGELPEETLFDPPDLHAPKVAVMGCYAGPPEEGERALAPLRRLADPLADESGTVPYVDFQRVLDADYPDGMRYYWSSLYLEALPDAAVERVRHWAAAAPSPLSTVDVWHLGGAIADPDPGETAFPAREAPFLLGVEANWTDPADDAANEAWVRDCVADMRTFSDGSVYVNFPGDLGERPDRLRATFGADLERLRAVTERYDPDGVFGALD